MSQRRIEAARARIEAIRAQILTLDLVSSGSLQRRMTRCRKAGCHCMTTTARHGPYFEWGRMAQGRQVSTNVSAAQARLLREAIGNYRRIRALLRRWERESRQIIKWQIDANIDRGRT